MPRRRSAIGELEEIRLQLPPRIRLERVESHARRLFEEIVEQNEKIRVLTARVDDLTQQVRANAFYEDGCAEKSP